ncbi:MAG: hypothetical protein ACRD3W_29090, partial [Terriglobales bacterium]
MTKITLSAMVFTAALASMTATAGDRLFALDGIETRDGTHPNQRTYEFEGAFEHDFSNHFSWSVEYGNNGHFNQGIEHHLDYDGASIWAYTDVFDHQLRLAAGFGAMLYYDTTGGTYLNAHEDVHGLGTSYTLAATLYTFNPLLLQVRANFMDTGSLHTSALMLGVGYQFGANGYKNESGKWTDDHYDRTKNEVTFYIGKAVVNASGGAHSNSFSAEYRHDLGNYFQVSERALYEGTHGRRGLISEGWLAKSFLDDRLSVGVGIGAYLAQDTAHPGSSTFVIPVRSFTAAYQLTTHADVRLTWD